jgi:hypothetical protein
LNLNVRQLSIAEWLRQMAHDQEVMGSNPGTVYWIDVGNGSYYIIRKIMKIKIAQKILKKKKFQPERRSRFLSNRRAPELSA